MSSKPSTVPTWNSGGANRSVPSAGTRISGFALDQIPTSGLFNNEMNLYGQWAQYLSDGDLALNNVTVAGTLGVTGATTLAGSATVGTTLGVGGNTTVGGTLGVTGAATVGGTLGVTGVTTLASVGVTGAATVGTTLGVTGNTTIGGTLGVTGVLTPSGGIAAFTANGAITAAAGITVSTGQALTLSGTSTLTVGTGATSIGGTLGVTGLITATAGVTAAANQNVTVSGTGRLKHGTYTLNINGASFVSRGGATPGYDFNGASGVASAPYMYPISMVNGKRITAIRVVITDLAASTIRFTLEGNTGTVLATSNTSLGNGTQQTLTASSLTQTITSGDAYSIQMHPVSGTGITSVQRAEIDFDD